MAGITTHVLDNVSATPGAGMRIDFSKKINGKFTLQKTVYTNEHGRTDGMILTPPETKIGEYELLFYVSDYYKKQGVSIDKFPFVEEVPVRFSIFDTSQHYHVPMLATPSSCTTYRGS